ncbi:hypothetical protein F4777DRAFT_584241 [Nemania sp. FL0916]|nr:hypothetical protein F4777DRAFT_584241 [Nemania sp. FL0916]
MATVRFVDNHVDVRMHAAVVWVDLQVTVHYRNNNPTPKTFGLRNEMTFPRDALVTLTEGGPNDNEVRATDRIGNIATWLVVGGS